MPWVCRWARSGEQVLLASKVDPSGLELREEVSVTMKATRRDEVQKLSITATWSSLGSVAKSSSDALAAAQASGLPEYVGPCINALSGSSDSKAE